VVSLRINGLVRSLLLLEWLRLALLSYDPRMDVIPAIDIRGGKCVQLKQGDYARETVYGVDPVAMAQHWVSQGARRLHVVDLDAARDGGPGNEAIVARIVRQAGVPVQVAGGVRDHVAIHRWIDSGAQRVVIGTLAIEQPDVVEKAMIKHGDRIAIAIDERGGKAAVKGWLATSEATVEAVIRDLSSRGARHFVYTDTSRDGMLEHLDAASFASVVDVVRSASADSTLIYSGGVTSSEDLSALTPFALEGVIVGTALYDGRIDLPQVLPGMETAGGA
jgi:phosphoribosylformimino-5-aminoimidazole carboxamide ribotide isomerase